MITLSSSTHSSPSSFTTPPASILVLKKKKSQTLTTPSSSASSSSSSSNTQNTIIKLGSVNLKRITQPNPSNSNNNNNSFFSNLFSFSKQASKTLILAHPKSHTDIHAILTAISPLFNLLPTEPSPVLVALSGSITWALIKNCPVIILCPHNSSVPSDPATLLKTCKFIYSYQISHILFESEIGKACHFQLSITANHVTAASAPGSWSLLDQLPPSSSPASASFSSNSMISSETPVAVAEELLFSLDSSTEYLSWVGCFQDVLFKTPEPSSSPSSSKRLYASPARINSTISSTPPAHHQQHVQHQQQHPHHSSSKKAFKSFIKQPSSSASASSAIDQHIQEYERFETIHYKESRKLSLPRAKSTTMTANLKSSKNLKFLSTSMIQFPFDKTTKPKTVTTTDTPPPPPITTSSATTHRKSISLDFRRGDDQGRDVMTSTDTNTITTTPSASRRKSLDIRRLFSNPLTSSKQQQQHQQSEGQEILEGQPMVKIIDTLPPLFIPPVKPSERINTTISSASSSPSRGDGVGDVPPLMKEEEAYSLSRVHQKQKQLQHLKTGSGSNVNSVSEFVGKSKKWIASLNAKLMSGGSGGVSSGTAARSTELVSEDIIIKSNSGDAEPSEPSTKQENDEGMDVSPPRTSNFQLQKQQRQQQQHLYDLSTTSSYRSMPTYSLGGSVNGLKFLNKNPAATSTSSTATIPSSYQMQQPQYQRRPISTAPATTASSFTQHVFGGEADEFYRQLFSAQQQQLEHEHQHQHQQQQHDDDGHGDDLSFEVGDEEASFLDRTLPPLPPV